MIRVETNVFGVFATKNGKIIERIDFPTKPDEVAKRLSKTVDSVCDEEKELIGRLIKTNVKEVGVRNTQRFMGQGLGISFVKDLSASDPIEIAAEAGISKKDAVRLITEVNAYLTREKLRIIERDQLIIQAVGSLNDIEDAANTLVERLREWYSLHFPELDHIVVKNDVYASLVDENGKRESFKKLKAKYDREFEDKITEASASSLGIEFDDEDIAAVRKLTAPLTDLYKSATEIESYVDGVMEDVAPNLRALAGGVLGARLIAYAGSLKRLAILPAGTIQILGAEDAFFRFLRTGNKPPKHGVIFQLPEIRGAPKSIRGKLARTFAAKLAIAARADAFKGEFIGDKLKEGFQKRARSLSR